MDEKKAEKNREVEIDLKRVMSALLNRAWLIILVAVLVAVVTLVYTVTMVTPKYQASVMFYVNNNALSVDGIVDSITSSDRTASKDLVDTYMVLLDTRETLNDVIDYAEVNRTYGEVSDMISASSVNDTEVFQVVVTSADPQEAEAIANAIGYILPTRIDDIIDGASSKLVSSAILPTAPSSPSYTRNTIIGFALGLVVMMLIVALRNIFDVTIRNEEDVADSVRHPVLAAIPDMEIAAKSGSHGYKKYAYRNGRYAPKDAPPTDKIILVGAKIDFAAAEAYKLLRTKIQFSFADDASCHIIGVSSALTGEGKSLTSVNLAYSMSQLGKRVLLIDCDMRRPSIAEKLPVKTSPGLSDYLSGQARSDNLIQHCGLEDDICAFHVIAAGRIPPNPMELIGSNKMERMLEALRANYDYIILDLPPVGEVGDALAAVTMTDGMLLVARQDYGNRVALNATIRQFEFVKSRILGVVLNCANEDGQVYGKKYYKRYGKSYSKRGVYYNAAAVAAKRSAGKDDTQE